MTAQWDIERLVRRERYLRDTEQWSSWRQCYHRDSSRTFINISWFKGQIDDFVEKSRHLASEGISPTHTVIPTDVQVKDHAAFAVSSCNISTRFEYQGRDYDLVADLRLVSRLELVEGRWTLLSLEGIYLQDRILPVVPSVTNVPSFDLERIEDIRTSYKCLIWNIERKGRKVRRDLPGIDRPESFTVIMKSAQDWVGVGTVADSQDSEG